MTTTIARRNMYSYGHTRIDDYSNVGIILVFYNESRMLRWIFDLYKVSMEEERDKENNIHSKYIQIMSFLQSDQEQWLALHQL